MPLSEPKSNLPCCSISCTAMYESVSICVFGRCFSTRKFLSLYSTPLWTKAIAAFLCPSAESEPSLNGSLLSQIQLVSFFHTSSFQVVIIRFRWCVDAKICGMFVCEIKPIVWRIFLEISAKTMDSIPYRNYVYCYYPYVRLKVENHPALLTVSSMVFLSPRSTNTTEEQPDGKNAQLPFTSSKDRPLWARPAPISTT